MENNNIILEKCRKYAKYLADEVKKYIVDNGMTIGELAEECGLGESTIKRIQKGESVPSFYSITAISMCIKKDLWFMGTKFGIEFGIKSLFERDVFLEFIENSKIELSQAKIIREYLDLLILMKRKEIELRDNLD